MFALAPVSPIAVDEDYLDDIARAFAQIIDAKSPFTSGHSERVAVYADMIAAELGFTAERRRWLKRAALLHDIGKLGVSNAILDKNGKLDDAEWQDMRNHAALSETILARVAVFHEMACIGGGHHERLDGKGYPRGLKGDAIVPEIRIVSVADVFDALTADRPYRAAMPLEKALGIMRADVGTAFDPACFAALERALAAIEGGSRPGGLSRIAAHRSSCLPGRRHRAGPAAGSLAAGRDSPGCHDDDRAHRPSQGRRTQGTEAQCVEGAGDHGPRFLAERGVRAGGCHPDVARFASPESTTHRYILIGTSVVFNTTSFYFLVVAILITLAPPEGGRLRPLPGDGTIRPHGRRRVDRRPSAFRRACAEADRPLSASSSPVDSRP